MWTEQEIKKTVSKYESVEVYRETDEKEITIEVYYNYIGAEKPYFNGLTGDGHPGSAAEIEIILALNPDKQPVELTEKEEEQAKEKIYENLEDEDDEDPPDSYDREYGDDG